MEALSPHSERWALTLLGSSGVRLTVDASWIVFAGLLYWTLDAVVMPFLAPEIDRQAYRFMAAAGALGIFLLVVLREAVVALVAARRRVPLDEIRILPVNGVLRAPPAAASLGQELLLLAVGTAVSALAGVGLLLLLFKAGGPATPLAVGGVAFFLGLAGLAHAVAGLLPISLFPGGRVLCAALGRWVTSPARAARAVRCIDFAAAAAALAAGLWFLTGADHERHIGVWLVVAGAVILAYGWPWRAAAEREPR
jgi:Zn-dependent protease